MPEWLKIDVIKFRRDYEDLQQQLREMGEFAARYGIALPPEPADLGGPVARSERFAHMTVRLAAAGVLTEAERPLHLSELYEELILGGAKIGGADPKNSLCGTIRGDKQFVNLGRNVWDLAERHEGRESGGGAEG